jgi:hypothetical protein
MINDISPSETKAYLQKLGCTDIRVEALPMQNAATENEILIIARAPQNFRHKG